MRHPTQPRRDRPPRPRKSCSKGQGVVEYAGAIVVAAGLLAMAMLILPTGTGELFNSIYNTVADHITGQLNTYLGMGGGADGGGAG
ncbi:MAG: hypothetical protein SFZ03_10055 [Candidatus Melainabacteria bacterium]|nr:hypothetical protein [Candidatus Melainabacteria bacterium]